MKEGAIKGEGKQKESSKIKKLLGAESGQQSNGAGRHPKHWAATEKGKVEEAAISGGGTGAKYRRRERETRC